jgi:flagellar basal-body rod protein FlgB
LNKGKIPAMASLSTAMTERMNFLVQRQGIVAGNIANANTPKYLAKDLVDDGKGAISGFAMAVTNAQHMAVSDASLQGKVTEDTRFIQHNGNSVRLDDEMLKMNQTQLDYRMMTELYAKQLGMQKMALGQR